MQTSRSANILQCKHPAGQTSKVETSCRANILQGKHPKWKHPAGKTSRRSNVAVQTSEVETSKVQSSLSRSLRACNVSSLAISVLYRQGSSIVQVRGSKRCDGRGWKLWSEPDFLRLLFSKKNHPRGQFPTKFTSIFFCKWKTQHYFLFSIILPARRFLILVIFKQMTGDIGSLTTDATPPANSFQLSRFSADPQIKPGD